MSYFQAKFSHAPANMPDARQTQNFINQLQEARQSKKRKGKGPVRGSKKVIFIGPRLWP